MVCYNNDIIAAFFELLSAGLWEKECHLTADKLIDWNDVYQLAQEQSVLGLVLAGIEHVTDKKPSKEVLLQFVGEGLKIEQHNTAMNSFIGVLVGK